MLIRKPFPRIILIISILALVALACGSSDEPDLAISVELPSQTINIGDSFSINVSVSNPGQYNLEISKVNLPNSLLEGADLVSTIPEMSMQPAGTTSTSFTLDRTIAPSGKETFTFNLKASKAGDYQGTGGIVTGSGTYNFEANYTIEGSNQAGWDPGISPEQTPQPLGAIPYQAVVQIGALVEVEGEYLIGWTGSGTIITPDGLILTNAHVVLSDRFYTVQDLLVYLTVAQDAPPVKTYYASVLQADAALDIAVIKVREDMQGNLVDHANLNLPAVPLGDSDSLRLGDPIVILGYPGIGGDTITLTRGEVSGFTAEEPYGNRAFVKTSATIAGGNSGGLACNEKGEIIGIPTQVGSGDTQGSIVDCRPLADTNRDGVINDYDNCVPTGGFINALRPIKLAGSMIQAARQGQVAVERSTGSGETFETGGDLLFQDDFSNPDSGWYIGEDENGFSAYENGELVIKVNTNNYIIYSDLEFQADEMILIVDARVLRSVGDGDFGIICGYQDNDNFTLLEISEDGYYTFWKYESGQYKTLVDWTYSDEVARGGPYTLAAYCGYEGLALVLNETLLAEFDDPGFQAGSVGLVAGTYDVGGFKVAFDNFYIMKP